MLLDHGNQDLDIIDIMNYAQIKGAILNQIMGSVRLLTNLILRDPGSRSDWREFGFYPHHQIRKRST